MMIPFQIVLIPQYILMVKLGWTDTYLSLIAPTMMSAFGIVLFRQFFMAVPQALIDAARMDGCSELRILFQVIWPLSRPVVMTVALLTFMTNWNEVLWPLDGRPGTIAHDDAANRDHLYDRRGGGITAGFASGGSDIALAPRHYRVRVLPDDIS